MIRIELSEDEVSLMTTALRTAMEVWAKDAENMRGIGDKFDPNADTSMQGFKRMAEQFHKQVKDADILVAKLEEA